MHIDWTRHVEEARAEAKRDGLTEVATPLHPDYGQWMRFDKELKMFKFFLRPNAHGIKLFWPTKVPQPALWPVIEFKLGGKPFWLLAAAKPLDAIDLARRLDTYDKARKISHAVMLPLSGARFSSRASEPWLADVRLWSHDLFSLLTPTTLADTLLCMGLDRPPNASVVQALTDESAAHPAEKLLRLPSFGCVD